MTCHTGFPDTIATGKYSACVLPTLKAKEPPYLADFLQNTVQRSTSGDFLPTTAPGILANLEDLKASRENPCIRSCKVCS